MENMYRDSSASSMPRGHVLLVSPLTFSYHISIISTLQTMGYEVTWWDERASSAVWYKIALRLLPNITKLWSERHFLAKLHQLTPTSITHILVVKGEGLSKRVACKIRDFFPNASMGLYLWDGVKNVNGAMRISAIFDSVSTFDPVDSKNFGWVNRPLFWRHDSMLSGNNASLKFDWSFIGTVHSDRHRVISKLRQSGSPDSKNFVFCYFQSRSMLLGRMIFDPTLWSAPSGTLSTKPMSVSDVAQILKCSKAVIDVEHPRQHGLTMRTIETLIAGKKLVTTNNNIIENDLYHPSRVHVIDRFNPVIPQYFLDLPFLPIPESLKEKYSCGQWAHELLSTQDTAKIEKNNIRNH
jgi:hypothetical protein